MAEQNKSEGCRHHPFDVPTVQHLIKLMSDHEMTEVYLEAADQVIRLRRGAKQIPLTVAASALAPAAQAPVSAVASPAPSPASAPVAPAAPTKKLLEIKSPTPGTFYRSSSPDAEAFVKVGSRIKADTVVCIIEAMKVFNEIPAEISGTVSAIKVEDKQPVEYGQVLFLVEPE